MITITLQGVQVSMVNGYKIIAARKHPSRPSEMDHYTVICEREPGIYNQEKYSLWSVSEFDGAAFWGIYTNDMAECWEAFVKRG